MDFLVLSHLRWNFVFQRPQQLMTRCSKSNRVFFWEEPIFDNEVASITFEESAPGVYVAVPHLPAGLPEDEICRIQEWMLAKLRHARYGTLLAVHVLLLCAAGRTPTEIARIWGQVLKIQFFENSENLGGPIRASCDPFAPVASSR